MPTGYLFQISIFVGQQEWYCLQTEQSEWSRATQKGTIIYACMQSWFNMTACPLKLFGLHVMRWIFCHCWWYPTGNIYQLMFFFILHLWLISCWRMGFAKENSVLNFKVYSEVCKKDQALSSSSFCRQEAVSLNIQIDVWVNTKTTNTSYMLKQSARSLSIHTSSLHSGAVSCKSIIPDCLM